MRKADNLPPYCAVVKKSRSLNFLDLSGPAWPVTGVLCFNFLLKCKNVMKARPVGAVLFHADGQTETKLTFDFRNSVNVPKNHRGESSSIPGQCM